jgi:nucleoside-diphosphate-sugar epimerase
VLGAALAGRTARVLGDLDQPHTYTYIPDIGEGRAVLGEHPDAPGEVWHLPNDPDTHSTRRELLEMRYQFEEPFIVDSSKMAIRLGARATPYERALAESLAAYGRAAEPEAKVSSRTRNRTPGLRTGPAARSRGGEDAR